MAAHRRIVAFARNAWAHGLEGRSVEPAKHPVHSLHGIPAFAARLIEAALPDLGFLLMCGALLVQSRPRMIRGF
ncbi:hypothetical protein [Sphingomonas sp. PR090111-T3T-6A]|uniref:hypothetical protein n=1 Tax=Sphingomonas sp. PR090111-T3T-6A TaxID=685778 RepID=UPI0003671DC9|nr:hypothetical protein [Sphingomonas sp. PR090111-T3T-6A]